MALLGIVCSLSLSGFSGTCQLISNLRISTAGSPHPWNSRGYFRIKQGGTSICLAAWLRRKRSFINLSTNLRTHPHPFLWVRISGHCFFRLRQPKRLSQFNLLFRMFGHQYRTNARCFVHPYRSLHAVIPAPFPASFFCCLVGAVFFCLTLASSFMQFTKSWLAVILAQNPRDMCDTDNGQGDNHLRFVQLDNKYGVMHFIYQASLITSLYMYTYGVHMYDIS